MTFHDLPQRAADLRNMMFLPYNLGDLPLHLACGSASARVARGTDYAYRVFATPLPHGMFCKVADGLYVASPEQCFLEAAVHLSRMQLVQLGMELCGTYSLALDEPGGFTKWKNPEPLTTRNRIASYVERQAGKPGHEAAHSAAKYIKNGSASPAETRLYMRLHMPKRYGAYGLKFDHALNPMFALEKVLAHEFDRAGVSPDIYYPGKKVVIEYDSKMHHSGVSKIEFDSRRRNLLLGMGVRVFTVTAGMMADLREFDKFVFELRLAMGARKACRLGYDELREHARLVSELNATSMLGDALRFESYNPKASAWALPAIDRDILEAIDCR